MVCSSTFSRNLDFLKKLVTLLGMKTFDIYLDGKKIDTVFYSNSDNVTIDEVKQSLINHDGYNVRIKVKAAKKKKA